MVVPLAPRTGPTLKGRVQAGGRRFSGGQQHRAATLAKPHLQVGEQSTGIGGGDSAGDSNTGRQ